ncbi:MAG: hypothetical protein GXY77_06910 [Fibrobacter sp.]|nr:hypothetical protein [Fibrobacter sp.]
MINNKFIHWYFLLFVGLMTVVSFADFSDDHNNGNLDGWTAYGSRSWSESNGNALPADGSNDSGFLINDIDISDDGIIEVTCTADQWNGNRGGVVFRWTSPSSFYYVGVLPGNQWSNSITFCKNNMDLTTGIVVASSFAMRTTFSLKIEMQGSVFKFYIDDVLRGQITDESHSSGKAGYGYSAAWNRYISFDEIIWTDAEPETFELTTSVVGEGSVSPDSGTYPNGENVTLTATPADGWVFDHWSQDLSGSDNPVTITMDSDKNIVAHFTEITWELATSVEGEGTVSPESGTYVEGSEVELTATPADGWVFDHWSGGLSGSDNPATITMDSDKNVTAHFTAIPTYDLTTSVEGEGSVSPESGSYLEGSEVELTATPADGWVFDHWSGGLSGSDNPATITMDSDKNVTAHFTAIPTYDLTTSVEGEGTVSPESGTYVEGSEVELTATPADGWVFDHWSQDLSGSENPATITMDSDKNVTAHFTAIPTYDLTTSVEGEGTVSPESGSYVEGSEVELTATPADGWVFDHWSGGLSGSENPSTVTMDSDKNVTAHFAELPTYELEVLVDGPGSVNPESGIYPEGTQVEIIATANEGYMFDHWSGDINGEENPLTVTMDSNITVTAHFVEYIPQIPNSEKLSITAKLFDNEGGPVGADEAVTLDAVVRLYTGQTAGLLKYTETFLQADGQGILIDKGNLIIRLREGTSNDNLKQVLQENPHLWVEISIESEPLERVPLTGAAYLISDAD